jgi:hypothetical protein
MKGKILAVLVAVAAIALLSAGAAQASITSTKHNLSSTGTGTMHASAGQQNGEICVWCHTPHAANISFVGAPLWNKAVPSGTYTPYGTTVGGTVVGAPSNSSKACLSCHDGVNAVNSIVNQAGSGGVVAGGYNVAFGITSAGTGTYIPATWSSDIGTDLRDDHPVSITYTPGNASLNPTTTAFGTKTIATAMLKGTLNNQLECGSCHDPHVAANDTSGLGGQAAGPMFLRISNTNSALCLVCHGK